MHGFIARSFRWSAPRLAGPVAVLMLVGSANVAYADALCTSSRGHLRYRDVCQSHESEVDLWSLLSSDADDERIPLRDWPIPDEPLPVHGGLESIAAAGETSLTIPTDPCRLIDTRPGQASALAGDDVGPFTAGEVRTYTITGFCDIPVGAEAASLNISVVPGLQGGFVSAAPGGSIAGTPGFASVVFAGSGPAISNSLIVQLNGSGQLDVYAAVPGDVVVDSNAFLASPTDAEDNTGLGFGALAGLAAGGEGNTAMGAAALSLLTDSADNTAVGSLALRDTTSDGSTAVGESALRSNTSGTNTAVGQGALQGNTTGSANTVVGRSALIFNNGSSNTAVGAAALFSATTGSSHVAMGQNAILFGGNGSANVAIGFEALRAGGGSVNTAVGRDALRSHGSGDGNLALGADAGDTLTAGSNNIYLDSDAASATESNQIRIGDGTHSNAFIPAIVGNAVDQNVAVLVGTDGRLGTSVISSRARKTEVADIGTRSAALQRLRPVSFRYRDRPAREHFGLIAEEAAEVLPEIVVFDDEGKPRSVRYDRLTPLLLNELLQSRRIIDGLRGEVAELSGRLDALESARTDNAS